MSSCATEVENADVATRPVIAVIIVGFNGRRDLEACLRSVTQPAALRPGCPVVYVDNASVDGSAEFVQDTFREVVVVRSAVNTGYAGGGNLGWCAIQRRFPSVKYVALLNQDAFGRPGWLDALATFLEEQPHAAIAQPKIVLAGTDRINTVGNRCHFLGFTFLVGYNERDVGQYDSPRPIDAASGAAFLVRADFLATAGLFESDLFLYCEDVELSWRARLAGREVWYVPSAVVEHQYSPKAPFDSYFHLQRNRWILLLSYYRWATLALCIPALVFMELGQIAFVLRHGSFGEWTRAMGYFLRPAVWRRIHQRRIDGTRLRAVSDRRFLAGFAGRIEFGPIQNVILRWIGNPILGAYWGIAGRFVRW